MSIYSDKKQEAAITPLVDNKLHQIEHKINQIENKLNDATTASIKPKFEANFRATGFLIDGAGYIITNAHVIKGASFANVYNNGKEYKTKIVFKDLI